MVTMVTGAPLCVAGVIMSVYRYLDHLSIKFCIVYQLLVCSI